MKGAGQAFASGRLAVDLDALLANHRTLAHRVAPAQCAAVIKADAYGLGVLPVAATLAAGGCRAFFVAHLAEGLEAKPMLPDDAEIFLLNGLPAGAEEECARAGLIPVLNSMGQARRWAAFGAAMGRPGKAALQIDSGMSRLGLSPDDAAALAGDVAFRAAVTLRLIMSHLACADRSEAPSNGDQLRAFEVAAACFPDVPRSLANSGGVFLPSSYHQAMARPGIAHYGGAANDGIGAALKPVVRLQAQIVQLRAIGPGTGVGYGLDFRADRLCRLATLGVGYADGWPRSLGGGRGSAWFNGIRLPTVGRISMDSMTVDIGALEDGTLAEGDWVDLIGPDQGIDAVGVAAGTISYEILTSLGHRYERVYLGGHMGSSRP
ncbi:alanine racemase [Sphingobium aquiterrae]|uniref:alanine racemase n=1 Tax=Sphingobium aquiterrae TaxID=2038656 RepID=UPI00301A5C02